MFFLIYEREPIIFLKIFENQFSPHFGGFSIIELYLSRNTTKFLEVAREFFLFIFLILLLTVETLAMEQAEKNFLTERFTP